MIITVFTPTYNRAYILENLYRSLQRQEFCDFEWLIIDDDSIDNTEQLVQQWIAEGNDFPIRYYKQENGGKCRAINRALDLAQGKLFFVVDSDDYLTDDALDKITQWEAGIDSNERFCGVSGNLGTSENKTTNHLFEDGSFDGGLLERYHEVTGERAFAFYTDVHKRYPYPTFDGEKFLTEAVVWNRMAHDGYKMRFYNDVICIYEYLDDGLTRAGNSLFLRNPRGYGLWLREKAEFTGASFWEKWKMWYTFYCDTCCGDADYRITKRQCAEYICAPAIAISACAIIHSIRHLFKGNR